VDAAFFAPVCALAGLAISGFLIWLGSYHIDAFPVTFIEGQGVTPFKAIYEYVLCALNVLAALLFWYGLKNQLWRGTT